MRQINSDSLKLKPSAKSDLPGKSDLPAKPDSSVLTRLDALEHEVETLEQENVDIAHELVKLRDQTDAHTKLTRSVRRTMWLVIALVVLSTILTVATYAGGKEALSAIAIMSNLIKPFLSAI